MIFLPGDYFYLKCGVMVLDVIPQSAIQINMFDDHDRTKRKVINGVMDK